MVRLMKIRESVFEKSVCEHGNEFMGGVSRLIVCVYWWMCEMQSCSEFVSIAEWKYERHCVVRVHIMSSVKVGKALLGLGVRGMAMKFPK